MKVTFVTLFPEICRQVMGTGVIGRGVEKGLIEIHTVDLRNFSKNRYGSVDDTPFGGGPGMVFRPEPVVEAVESLNLNAQARLIMTSPGGVTFDQSLAETWSRDEELVFICGRYEGIDERVRMLLSPTEVSAGDYVMTGGELPALSMADAVCRLLPGVLGCAESPLNESFAGDPCLEYPQFTRPRTYRGLDVPAILLSGHHGDIERWRKAQGQSRTATLRPDLIKKKAG